MSQVTVDNADVLDEGADYVLYFNPPLKAYMLALNDAGQWVKVLANIDAFYVRDNKFSFEYTDPDCDAMGVSDFCENDELEFVVTHEWKGKQ